MKTEIVDDKKVQRLPEVGEAWKHLSNDTVFVRIDDEYGRRAIGLKDLGKDFFFSVSLTSGCVAHTTKDYTCIILEPVGGAMRFQAKESK